jgi:hypothetical protein
MENQLRVYTCRTEQLGDTVAVIVTGLEKNSAKKIKIEINDSSIGALSLKVIKVTYTINP